MGLRNLEDMQKALHMRFAWNLIQGESLWARFFKGKYVGSSPWCIIDRKKRTRFWKMIVNSIPCVLNNAKWRVRDVNILFWYDKWRDGGPLIDEFQIVGNLMLKVKECKLSNSWDVELLSMIGGQDNLEEIIEALAVCSSMEWHPWMWHKLLPLKISVLMWKAWNMALSVDDHLRRIGIPIVSRYDCYDEGKYEDQNHTLFECEFAKELWHYYGATFGLPLGLTWRETILQILNIPALVPDRKFLKLVAWQKLAQGWFKLNTDGSSLGNPSSSRMGGIIRNDQGHMVYTFNSYIGYGSNNRAELLAVLQGLKACKDLGINFVKIELDSQVVISWWNRRRGEVWYLEDFWEETLALMDSMVCIARHVYWEGNKVIDWLARNVATGLNSDGDFSGMCLGCFED
ncbi:hypothetical protein F2P56_014505 [Juglans regia]|uniref:RNase H type-1 domain-containing protein n=2 Tax=Juglans regia TaxID=51240 RepID=A0A833XDS8_JUGRE|nr:uncharacterized protein LOC108996433 [Juglans regia]KAF5464430.1 hypothetical protein F2P56_014505 [Juglans regia]